MASSLGQEGMPVHPDRVAEAAQVPLPALEPAGVGGAGPKPLHAVSAAWETGPLERPRSVWKALSSRKGVTVVARILLAAYFVNLTAEQVEVWWMLAGTGIQKRWPDDPEPDYSFPLLWVALVLPSAVLVLAGVQVVWSGFVLLAACVLQDAYLTWRQVVNVMVYGGRPNELVVKRLAVTGVALLVVARAARSNPRLRSYAGLLTGLEDESDEELQHPSVHGPGGSALTVGVRSRQQFWRSVLLLLGRLFISALLLFSGWAQVRRIRARGGALWLISSPESKFTHHHGIRDSHDNTWLLLQLVLAFPFLLGLKTRLSACALALVLVCEAVTCWPPWFGPTWYYRAHVRLHFFTDLALVGGLLLLQGLGPGHFTLDELLQKKQR